MTSSFRDATEQALARIEDAHGEGKRSCLTVYAEQARVAAHAADVRATAGQSLGPLDGVVITIKDLFDVRGEVTRAGSPLLARTAQPATIDAPAVARLRAAGAVIVAKTNMTEFAFSGVGANPHFGTPGNPFDRGRIPGGSTSGGAVACSDGIGTIAIGTDTGGSTRIPAALCGLVGWKPTASRIPRTGVHPLAPSLDSVGAMARSVEECVLADSVLAMENSEPLIAAELRRLRVGVLQGAVLDSLDHLVASAFERSVRRLTQAHCSDVTMSVLARMDVVNQRGGIAPKEAYDGHRALLTEQADAIDPNVRARMLGGAKVSDEDYKTNLRERSHAIALMDRVFDDFDVLVLPTTPITAPTHEAVSTPEGFATHNRLLLRNTSIANFFDLCAISLPTPDPGSLSSGVMLLGRSGGDRALLRAALAVEAAFKR